MQPIKACSVDGCGKPRKAKGFCHSHYMRERLHGTPTGGGAPKGGAKRYFDEVVRRHEGDECLIWPYGRVNGYGRMWMDGRKVIVSRVLCEEVNGPPPSDDHEASHTCGRGSEGCVTKSHLRWATHAENCADKITHGTHKRGDKTGRAKVSEALAREILSLKGKESKLSIATRLGVPRTIVTDIHRAKSWGWLDA